MKNIIFISLILLVFFPAAFSGNSIDDSGARGQFTLLLEMKENLQTESSFADDESVYISQPSICRPSANIFTPAPIELSALEIKGRIFQPPRISA